jgi:feruloyl esterase
MKRRSGLPRGGKGLAPLLGIGVVAGSVVAAVPAWASVSCTVDALNGLGVTDVTVASATPVSPGTTPFPHPAFCDVFGQVATHGFGAPDGSATFHFQLPTTWNGKFLFFGVGGFAGLINGIAPNPVDFVEALNFGYATATTDTGHQATLPAGSPSSTDGSWALTPSGQPDQAKLTDYFFRATHEVTVAGKQFAKSFYGAQSLKRAYFEGCSNGGRQAYVEATKFPEDFDGIIAGDPFLDIRSLLAGENFQKQQLTPTTFIPAALLPAIDTAIRTSCDAADGVADGLIQNPAKCSFDPQSLGPSPGSGLLTHGQVDTLRTYFSALRDDDGHVLYTGASVSDLASPSGAVSGADLWSTGFIIPKFADAEPWGGNGFGGAFPAIAPVGYQFVDHGIQFIVERNPTFNLREFDDESPIGRVSDDALRLFDERTEAGDGDVPGKLIAFIAQDRKMLVYHGFSDPALNAFRTINHYEALAQLIPGGFSELRENMRLFLVPGMHHCGGGPGPNSFETLTALDNWVEKGIAPDSIVAAHLNASSVPDRVMPLCAFPEQAQFDSKSGATPVNTTGAGWSCHPQNTDLLQVGPDGRLAGVGQQNEGVGDRFADDNGDHGHDGDR